MNFRRLILLAAAALVLGGCASGVKHSSPESATRAVTPAFSAFNVSLNEAAQKQLAENPQFSVEGVRQNLQQQLEARGFLGPTNTQTLDIVLTDLRMRSTFSAVMFGFMAGNDRLSGTVNVKDASGKLLKTFEVSASYALGGIAGGLDTRMSWLYGEFAKLATQTLAGDAK